MNMHMRSLALLGLILIATSASAQESQFRADLRREAKQIGESCAELTAKAVAGCVVTLATGDPLHVAVGSLAPQNGMGFGVAFVEHYTPNERWRISWNADAVRSLAGSWRGGAYMKAIHIPDEPGVVPVSPGSPAGNPIRIREYPVFNFYAQGTSLNTLFFFGPGPSITEAGRSVFSERQTIVGASAIVPLTAPAAIQGLRPSFVGAVNGRFVRIAGNVADTSPPIDQLYDERAAPGLSEQPAFTQFEEGIRLKPSMAGGHLRFNYLVDFQQFVGSSSARSSFHRWTVDLRHEIPLFRTVTSSGPRDTNGPDECFTAVGSTGCPPVSFSRNREGTIGFRLLTSSSTASEGHSVPFYFQPTLGGTDINGNALLSSYQDYRFRGPHLIALQETLEYSLWGPLGFFLMGEQGKITSQRSDLNFQDLEYSVSTGLTLRAGGFPVVNLSFAWGREGHHVTGSIDASLLGGSGRPSWF
jgi:hypothetical protein